jgi:hypothetical protein
MRARQLLAEKPHIAKANLYTAAAVGDVAAAADFLAKNADVHAKGGPFEWEPLLYAAYSRLDSEAEGLEHRCCGGPLTQADWTPSKYSSSWARM